MKLKNAVLAFSLLYPLGSYYAYDQTKMEEIAKPDKKKNNLSILIRQVINIDNENKISSSVIYSLKTRTLNLHPIQIIKDEIYTIFHPFF